LETREYFDCRKGVTRISVKFSRQKYFTWYDISLLADRFGDQQVSQSAAQYRRESGQSNPSPSTLRDFAPTRIERLVKKPRLSMILSG